MRIVLDPENRSIALYDADTFDDFSAEVVGDPTDEEIAAVIAGSELGRLHADGSHVVVDPERLRHLAGQETSPEWEAKFQAMCAYAGGMGWLESDGGIRVHIEGRVDPD